MPRFIVRQLVAWLLLLLVSVMAGCALNGPATIRRDHFDYATAISDSWKNQALLNIVRLRYLDQPVFLEVKSVVAGYNWEHTGSVTGTIISPLGANDEELELGYEGTFVERPTISYAPLGGAEFIKAILTPIDPSVVLALVDSDWPVDRIFETMVQSVNGNKNLSILSGVVSKPDPAFTRFIEILQKAQRENALSIQIKKADGKIVYSEIRIHEGRLSDEDRKEWEAVESLMGLASEDNTYAVVWGTLSGDSTHIAIKTRSVFHVLSSLALFVDVPPEDLKEGLAPNISPEEGDDPASLLPPVRIHAGPAAPKNSYAAVRYNGNWFWVSAADSDSKRTLGFLNLILTIMKSESGAAPQLVITTN